MILYGSRFLSDSFCYHVYKASPIGHFYLRYKSMKKLTPILLAILMAVIVAGCAKEQVIKTSFVAITYTVQVAEVAAILPEARQGIKESITTLRSHDYGEKQPVANELFDEVDSMMEKIDAVAAKDAKEAVILAGNVKVFVNQARLVYARILDLSEGETFTASQQIKFDVVKAHLASINNLYKKVERKGGDITAIVMQALQAIGTGIKLVDAYR